MKKQRTLGPLMIREQWASGSGFYKGDWFDVEWLIEQKETEGQSIRIKKDWWEKIEGEAMGMGRRPLLLLRFIGGPKPIELICVSVKDIGVILGADTSGEEGSVG